MRAAYAASEGFEFGDVHQCRSARPRSSSDVYLWRETPERLIAEAVLDGYEGGYPNNVPAVGEAVREWLSACGGMPDGTQGVAMAARSSLAFHGERPFPEGLIVVDACRSPTGRPPVSPLAAFVVKPSQIPRSFCISRR